MKIRGKHQKVMENKLPFLERLSITGTDRYNPILNRWLSLTIDLYLVCRWL